MNKFLMENNFISTNQSGFMTVDLFINKLLSITHKIHLMMAMK